MFDVLKIESIENVSWKDNNLKIRIRFQNFFGPIVYRKLALLVGFSRIIGAPVNLMTFPSWPRSISSFNNLTRQLTAPVL